MATKSKRRGSRVSADDKQYVTQGGEAIRVLPGNVPRFLDKRTGGDYDFLRGNGDKLSKLQHISAKNT